VTRHVPLINRTAVLQPNTFTRLLQRRAIPAQLITGPSTAAVSDDDRTASGLSTPSQRAMAKPVEQHAAAAAADGRIGRRHDTGLCKHQVSGQRTHVRR